MSYLNGNKHLLILADFEVSASISRSTRILDLIGALHVENKSSHSKTLVYFVLFNLVSFW